MGRAKEIQVKVIDSKSANAFVKKWHYSGKVVNNSKLHFGAFLDDKLHGVMSFGSPVAKKLVLGLVSDTNWNEMLELNRMAFDDYLPKNSESRCISIAIKLLKKNAPHIKRILSFSDGTQCGDGAIYRASGFKLTNIRETKDSWILPNGESYTAITMKLHGYMGGITKFVTKREFDKHMGSSRTITRFIPLLEQIGAKHKLGYQLRYIYLIDKSCKIAVPILPFSKIDELGAGMYKGQKISLTERQKQVKYKLTPC